MFRFLGLHTVFYRTHIDNSSLWTEVIYILYKYSINKKNVTDMSRPHLHMVDKLGIFCEHINSWFG